MLFLTKLVIAILFLGFMKIFDLIVWGEASKEEKEAKTKESN